MKKTDLRSAMDRRLSGLRVDERQRQQLLSHVKGEEEPMKKKSISVALVLAIIALVSVAIAAALSPTIEWLHQDFYDPEAILAKSTVIPGGQTMVLGPLEYELVETVIGNDVGGEDVDMIYGTVRVSVRDGGNIVLVPRDLSLSAPAGYLHQRVAPEGTESYMAKALRTGARIILAEAAARGLSVNGQPFHPEHFASDFDPSPENVLTYHFYMPSDRRDADYYTVDLEISNWEVRPEMHWLHSEVEASAIPPVEGTVFKENWTVEIRPNK